MEFVKNPKMARLYRNVVVTEKIDGTHGAIFISEDGELQVGSRNRFLGDGKRLDNFGFCHWVTLNADQLIETLGPGIHRGEWWGAGIQRRYDLDCKVFSLFAVHRFTAQDVTHIQGLDVVPILYQGRYTDDVLRYQLEHLEKRGSYAAPGFMDPEGLVMYHEASKQSFKYTLKGDGHKGVRA